MGTIVILFSILFLLTFVVMLGIFGTQIKNYFYTVKNYFVGKYVRIDIKNKNKQIKNKVLFEKGAKKISKKFDISIDEAKNMLVDRSQELEFLKNKNKSDKKEKAKKAFLDRYIK